MLYKDKYPDAPFDVELEPGVRRSQPMRYPDALILPQRWCHSWYVDEKGVCPGSTEERPLRRRTQFLVDGHRWFCSEECANHYIEAKSKTGLNFTALTP